MKNTMRNALLLSACVLTLSACSIFDHDRTGPDEYNVSPSAPLVMPPDFSLRPPEPGAARPQEVRAEDKAKQALLGTDATPEPTDKKSAIENALLGGKKPVEAAPEKTAPVTAPTMGTLGTLEQPEAMRTLIKPSAAQATDTTAPLSAAPAAETAAAAPTATVDEKLQKIVEAPSSGGSTISLKPKSTHFWDSWF